MHNLYSSMKKVTNNLNVYRFDVVLDGEKKISLKGMFVGAKVKRGIDWNNRDEVGMRNLSALMILLLK